MKKTCFVFAMGLMILIAGCKKDNLSGTDVSKLDKNMSNAGLPSGQSAYGKIRDIDGNVYKTICIGDQVWTVENLKVTRYRNGNKITNITDNTAWSTLVSGAWCYFGNDPANNSVYGKLYNFYAVTDPRGLAPKGWHVATNDDWIKLTNYLGGETVAGGPLKSTGTVDAGTGLWYSPNNGATNASGFAAHPGGARFYDGSFSIIGPAGIWWTSTAYDASSAWSKVITHGETNVGSYYSGSWKTNGLSVRCVKDKN